MNNIKKYNILLILTTNKITYKDNIIINNLKKKNIIIKIVNNTDNININNYQDIYCDNDNKYSFKVIKYISIINIIKNYLNKFNLIKDRLNILKDIFNGLDCIIISSGPTSKNINIKKLKILQNKYLIIAVKYIIDTLLKNDISVDCYFCSDYGSLKNNGYYLDLIKSNIKNTYISFAIHNKLKNIKYFDINFKLEDYYIEIHLIILKNIKI